MSHRLVLIALLMANCVFGQQVPVNMRHVSVPTDVYKTTKFVSYRWELKLTGGCSGLSFGFANLIKNGFVIPSTNGPIAVKCALEVQGQITPVYFRGVRTVLIYPGVTVFSDPLPKHILATDQVFVRTFVYCTNGTPMNMMCYGNLHGWGNDGYSVNDVVDAPLGAFTLGFDKRDGYGPVAILGIPDGHPTTATIVGDSIATGAGDIAFGTNRNCQPQGYLERALSAQGIPWVMISAGGDTASNFVSTSQWRMPLAPAAHLAICNYGINDVGSVYNESVDYIKSRLLAIWKTLSAHNPEVYQTTILPQTYQASATDYWLSLTNQGPTSTKPAAINAWLLDGSTNGAVYQAGGALTGVIDAASWVSVSNRWVVPSAPIYTGTITTMGSNTVADAACNLFVPGQLANVAVIKIVSGSAAGAMRVVAQNTETNFTISQVWPDGVSVGQNFEIWLPPTMDGTHPTPTMHAQIAAQFPNLVRPVLNVRRGDTGVQVDWDSTNDFRLETAVDLKGPWSEVDASDLESEADRRFYRLRRAGN